MDFKYAMGCITTSVVFYRPQQVLTIGLIQKIVNTAFVKIGKLREEIDYQMRTAAAALESHSRAKLQQALAKGRRLRHKGDV